jgi:hypothetical protein
MKGVKIKNQPRHKDGTFAKLFCNCNDNFSKISKKYKLNTEIDYPSPPTICKYCGYSKWYYLYKNLESKG